MSRTFHSRGEMKPRRHPYKSHETRPRRIVAAEAQAAEAEALLAEYRDEAEAAAAAAAIRPLMPALVLVWSRRHRLSGGGWTPTIKIVEPAEAVVLRRAA